MENFNHFIITRFNLKLYAHDKKKAPTRTEFWLRHRFELFEQYCIPSIAAQTCKNFTWLCLFDVQTPETYRQRIVTYQTICSNFYPIFYDESETLDLSDSLHNTIVGIINERKANVEYIITTNLDNDDSLSIHAIETIQQHIKQESSCKKIYSLLFGYQYFTKTKLLAKMRYTNNHFLTLTEPYNCDEKIKTIISYRHGRATKQIPTVYISTKMGMWLEVVHEDNVSNEFRININVRYIPVMKGRDLSDFGLMLKMIWWKQWLKSLTILPAGFTATGIKRLLTKSLRK